MFIGLTSQQQEVFERVCRHETQATIAKDMGVSVQRVSQIVRQLVDHGLLTEPKRAKFQRTDEPHQYVPSDRTPLEAVRFVDHASGQRIIDWAGEAAFYFHRSGDHRDLYQSGKKDAVAPGSWVVRTTSGRYKVMRHDDFIARYEAVMD